MIARLPGSINSDLSEIPCNTPVIFVFNQAEIYRTYVSGVKYRENMIVSNGLILKHDSRDLLGWYHFLDEAIRNFVIEESRA